MYSNTKTLSNLCNIKSFMRVLIVVNITIAGVFVIMISRGNTELPTFARELKTSFVKQNNILSGLNCTLEAGILSVKITDIWDSKVVKVMEHSIRA